jgi:choline dehydrogenase
MNETFDYIVCGAGSAGCVLANRLSADPGNSVLLLEAGGRDTNPWIHIPVGYYRTMHNPKTDWCYITEPVPGFNDRRIKWPRGKVLGGSSSINGLVYIRGQREDFDHWRQLGNTGWGFDDVLAYFLRSEGQERGQDAYHATDGPLVVSDPRVRWPLCDDFIAAAENIGVPRRDDFNGAVQEGVGYFQTTIDRGRRCSAARAFLRPVMRRKNLKVVTSAHIEKILFQDRRARGVRFRHNDQVVEVGASAEVILSAGAIGSPQILELSGIGAGQGLQALGMSCVHDLPGVGENLQDHMQVRCVYKTTQPMTLNNEVNSLFGKARIGIEYLLRRGGPMAMAASHVSAFMRTMPHVATPDIQFHFQPLSADAPGKGLHRFSAYTSSVTQLRPESRGTVHIKSPVASDYPRIQPNYLSVARDQDVTVAGLKLSRKICSQPPISKKTASEYLPGSEIDNDAALLEYARQCGETIYHPTSTCMMGMGKDAVVDERLRVHGLDRLRVADASIMPTIVSGNTNAPTIMIGEKAADMILEDSQC